MRVGEDGSSSLASRLGTPKAQLAQDPVPKCRPGCTTGLELAITTNSLGRKSGAITGRRVQASVRTLRRVQALRPTPQCADVGVELRRGRSSADPERFRSCACWIAIVSGKPQMTSSWQVHGNIGIFMLLNSSATLREGNASLIKRRAGVRSRVEFSSNAVIVTTHVDLGLTTKTRS